MRRSNFFRSTIIPRGSKSFCRIKYNTNKLGANKNKKKQIAFFSNMVYKNNLRERERERERKCPDALEMLTFYPSLDTMHQIIRQYNRKLLIGIYTIIYHEKHTCVINHLLNLYIHLY